MLSLFLHGLIANTYVTECALYWMHKHGDDIYASDEHQRIVVSLAMAKSSSVIIHIKECVYLNES